MNPVQLLMQRIQANDHSTAPARVPMFPLQITLGILLLCINTVNFLITDTGLRWVYLFVALLFVVAIVLNIIGWSKLKEGFVFMPQGLRFRSKTAIPWAVLLGASTHPKPSGMNGRDVLLHLTPEGVQWVQQNRKGFLRLSKAAPGVDVASIRGLSPEESAFVLNETIRLYRHRHGLPI